MQLAAGAAPDAGRQVVLHACAAIEAAAEGLEALSRALRDHVDRLRHSVPPATIDRAGLQAALGRLVELLRDSDMAAMEAVAGIHGQFGGALGQSLQALDDAVGALDFPRAMALCNQLIETGAG
jgi:signal transduction histidine kinase